MIDGRPIDCTQMHTHFLPYVCRRMATSATQNFSVWIGCSHSTMRSRSARSRSLSLALDCLRTNELAVPLRPAAVLLFATPPFVFCCCWALVEFAFCCCCNCLLDILKPSLWSCGCEKKETNNKGRLVKSNIQVHSIWGDRVETGTQETQWKNNRNKNSDKKKQSTHRHIIIIIIIDSSAQYKPNYECSGKTVARSTNKYTKAYEISGGSTISDGATTT